MLPAALAQRSQTKMLTTKVVLFVGVASGDILGRSGEGLYGRVAEAVQHKFEPQVDAKDGMHQDDERIALSSVHHASIKPRLDQPIYRHDCGKDILKSIVNSNAERL